MNINQVVNAFKAFETELFKTPNHIEGHWKNIRSGVYYRMSEIKGFFNPVKPNLSKKEKLQSLLSIIVNSLKHRATKPQTTKLVVLHPRTLETKGKNMDAYSYPYFQDDADSTFWSRSSIGEKPKSYSTHSKSLDGMYWAFMLFKVLAKLPYRPQAFKTYYAKLAPLFNRVNIDQSRFSQFLYCEYLNFNYQTKCYINLLQETLVKEVYLVDSYSKNAALIEACNRLEIKVIEFQHGIISNYHLGYSVAQPDRLHKLFPDKFLAWGPQWLNGCSLPSQIEIDYIEPFYKVKVKSVPKKNKLIIISQSVIGQELASYVISNTNLDIFDEVVFKLHPSELSNLEFYRSLFSVTNIRVSTLNIYKELNESTTAIGVFSTAMLEAVDFGCKVYFAPLHGSEYVADNKLIECITSSEFYVNT